MGKTLDYGEGMTEDAAKDARAQRRTWVTGGILLVLVGVVTFVARYELARYGRVKDVLWALAVLVLVFGLGRAGSITRRRPWTTIIVLLQLLVASPLAVWYLDGLVLKDPANPNAQEDSWGSIFLPYYVAVFALTVSAVLMIGAVAALPKPWSWAPAWGFGFTVIAAIIGYLSPLGGPVLRWALFYIPAIVALLLGGLLIVLGARATRHPAPARLAEESAVGG